MRPTRYERRTFQRPSRTLHSFASASRRARGRSRRFAIPTRPPVSFFRPPQMRVALLPFPGVRAGRRDGAGARIRCYAVKAPPFHYSRIDDLDLEQHGAHWPISARMAATSCYLQTERPGRSKGSAGRRNPSGAFASCATPARSSFRITSTTRVTTPSNPTPGGYGTPSQRDRSILLSLPEEDGLLHELDSITKEVIEEQLLAPFDDERVLHHQS